jgi:hypothetical protein
VDESRVVEIPAGPGAAPVEFRLRRAATVEVRLVRAGRLVEDARGEVRCTPAEGEATWPVEPDHGVARFSGLAPGEYRVSWSDGDRSVERTVNAPVAETTVVEVEVP